MQQYLKTLHCLVSLVLFLAVPVYAESMYVVAESVNKRTCPSQSCGLVGQAIKGEKLEVFETVDNYIRINSYRKVCFRGYHTGVKEGNRSCSAANGKVNGGFADWVNMQGLSSDAPVKPKDYSLIKDADDFDKHRDVFLATSLQLIQEGTCSKWDFKKYTWWRHSPNNNPNLYYTYCGGRAHADNEIVLNVANGKTFSGKSFSQPPSSKISTQDSQVESTSKYMPYESCLQSIRTMANQYGAPSNVIETTILRTVRFHASDGSILVTCSKPDQKMVITRSPRSYGQEWCSAT